MSLYMERILDHVPLSVLLEQEPVVALDMHNIEKSLFGGAIT
jgi:hypothetical protein